jgi:hypothetical protein
MAKKLASGTRVARELLLDSVIAVADWLVQEHSLALAKKTDEAAFNGDGTSTYGGIQGITTKINDGTHTAGVVAAAAGNNSFRESRPCRLQQRLSVLCLATLSVVRPGTSRRLATTQALSGCRWPPAA